MPGLLSTRASHIKSGALLVAAGLSLSACSPNTPSPAAAASSAAPSDAPLTPNGRANLEVINNDFQGQSGVRIVSHETSPVMINKIVVNGGRDSSCVFDTGANLYDGDNSSLPTKIQPGQWRHTEFYSPAACGEPTTVTISTDMGNATYSVEDPNSKALANGVGAPPAAQ